MEFLALGSSVVGLFVLMIGLALYVRVWDGLGAHRQAMRALTRHLELIRLRDQQDGKQ